MTNVTFPKIGIRPTIDGRRRGIRESLEEQTMNMAHSVAKLLESTLKYPDGSPVQTVISDSTIGGVKEAAMSKEKFDRAGICGTITVTPCWCYGSETMDMSADLPHAIWGFNGTERPGRFISQPSWQLTRKREFQLSVFTGMMYKMLMTPQSLKM